MIFARYLIYSLMMEEGSKQQVNLAICEIYGQ